MRFFALMCFCALHKGFSYRGGYILMFLYCFWFFSRKKGRDCGSKPWKLKGEGLRPQTPSRIFLFFVWAGCGWTKNPPSAWSDWPCRRCCAFYFARKGERLRLQTPQNEALPSDPWGHVGGRKGLRWERRERGRGCGSKSKVFFVFLSSFQFV